MVAKQDTPHAWWFKFATMLTPLFWLTILWGCAHNQVTNPPSAPLELSKSELRLAHALANYSHGLWLLNSQNATSQSARVQAAIQAYARGVELLPRNEHLQAALLSAVETVEEPTAVLPLLQNLVTQTPDNPHLHIALAQQAEKAEDFALAAAHCALVLEQQPAERQLALALIRLYFKAQQPTNAFHAMRTLLQQDAAHTNVMVPISWALAFHKEKKHPDWALECVDIALPYSRNPGEKAAFKLVAAESHIRLANTNLAATTLWQAYQQAPQELRPLLRLGELFKDTPELDQRLATLAAKERRGIEERLLLQAAVCSAREDHAQTAKLLTQYSRARLHQGYYLEEAFYLWHALTLSDSGQTHELEKVLHRALSAYPDSAALANFLAYFWAVEAQNLEPALQLINRALAQEPHNPAFLDTKGWILYQAQRPHEALQYLLKAFELVPREPEITLHTITVLKHLGQNPLGDFLHQQLVETTAPEILNMLITE